MFQIKSKDSVLFLCITVSSWEVKALLSMPSEVTNLKSPGMFVQTPEFSQGFLSSHSSISTPHSLPSHPSGHWQTNINPLSMRRSWHSPLAHGDEAQRSISVSHRDPVYPWRHRHSKPASLSTHDAPFWQGEERHSSISTWGKMRNDSSEPRTVTQLYAVTVASKWGKKRMSYQK